MKEKEILENLQSLMLKLGIELRTNEGEFRGGICQVKGQKFFVVNSSLSTAQQVKLLCRELAREDLSSVFVLPVIRERIQSVWARVASLLVPPYKKSQPIRDSIRPPADATCQAPPRVDS